MNTKVKSILIVPLSHDGISWDSGTLLNATNDCKSINKIGKTVPPVPFKLLKAIMGHIISTYKNKFSS